MRLCRELGYTNADTAMAWATSGGYESTACLWCDWGAQEIDLIVPYSTEEGHESVVRLCRDLGLDYAVCCRQWSRICSAFVLRLGC